MIVVVEGIDRVGKTTLVNMLVKAGFVKLKDEFKINKATTIDQFGDYSIGKCESFVKAAQELQEQGKNVVIDRLHLTEYVYGLLDRSGRVNVQGVWAVDMLLSNLGAVLCYVEPADINLSNELASRDQSRHSDLFGFAVKLSSMKKIFCDFNRLDDAFSKITDEIKEFDFYFASPFFSQEQIEREERLISHLRNLGFKVFSPKESCNLDSKAGHDKRDFVFQSNCDAIHNSRFVFAVTDTKDIGTIWEAGYAFGVDVPVIYYAETLGNNKFNLMLAQSGVAVFTNQNDVTKLALQELINSNYNKRAYEGEIE